LAGSKLRHAWLNKEEWGCQTTEKDMKERGKGNKNMASKQHQNEIWYQNGIRMR